MSFWHAFIQNGKQRVDDAEIEDIRYHLIRLLESEAPLVMVDPRFNEIQRSNMRFGIEDVQMLSASLDQSQIGLKLESYIKNFEPRLSNVMVELVKRKENENCIYFNIIAKVETQSGEQELVFDSRISLNDLTTSVTEDSYD